MRVLAIGAHPDDLELLCGGTLARFCKEGHSVVMCHAAQGDKGSSEYTSEEIAQIRRGEAQKAAEVAGAEHATLGIPDMGILAADEDQLRLVIDLVRDVRPELIITHHPADYHSDHVEISKLVFSASYAATSPLIPTDKPHYPVVTPLYYMETISGCGFAPTEYVDTTDVLETKIAMLDAHGSQMKWVKEYHGVDFIDMARTSAAYHGHQCGVTYAEGFIPNLTWLRGTTRRMLP
jgi:N-acetylglucosamine malate deacetylase 1